MGKVNAAINMIAALTEKKPNLLINFGTAGAIKTGLADIVEVGQSVQCEMDARPLGIALGATAFETETERFTLSDSPSNMLNSSSFCDICTRAGLRLS